jgi:hypothetical protein
MKTPAALQIGDAVRVKKSYNLRTYRGRVGVVESFNAPGVQIGQVFDVVVNFGWCNRGFQRNELARTNDRSRLG